MQLYGIESPWLQILCVTIALAIIFCIWYFVAKSKNNKKQMQRSIETCLGIYFVYLFGLFGVLIVCVYILMTYISKKNKDKNTSTPIETNQDNLDNENVPKINLYEESNVNTNNTILDKTNKEQPEKQTSEPDIDIYKL